MFCGHLINLYQPSIFNRNQDRLSKFRTSFYKINKPLVPCQRESTTNSIFHVRRNMAPVGIDPRTMCTISKHHTNWANVTALLSGKWHTKWGLNPECNGIEHLTDTVNSHWKPKMCPTLFQNHINQEFLIKQ